MSETVAELIARLKTYPQDATPVLNGCIEPIRLAHDPENNEVALVISQ